MDSLNRGPVCLKRLIRGVQETLVNNQSRNKQTRKNLSLQQSKTPQLTSEKS